AVSISTTSEQKQRKLLLQRTRRIVQTVSAIEHLINFRDNQPVIDIRQEIEQQLLQIRQTYSRIQQGRTSRTSFRNILCGSRIQVLIQLQGYQKEFCLLLQECLCK